MPLQETKTAELSLPRCDKDIFLNSLSRYAHVYLSEKCWMDEALRENNSNGPDQLERSSSFCFRGEIPPSDSSLPTPMRVLAPRKQEKFAIAVDCVKQRSRCREIS